MKPLLYILAIVATGAGIFFSMQLGTKFKTQQDIRIAANKKNDDLVKDQKDTSGKLAAEKSTLKKAQDDQTATELAINTAKAAETSLKREIAALDTTLEQQKADIAQVTATIKTIQDSFKDIAGPEVDINNVADKVKELKNKELALQKERDDLATNIEGATKTRDAKKAESARLADTKASRDKRFRQNSMVSVITAVNQEWGFVMVGAGSNTGFTPQTTLLVERDGRLIGKLQPTSIEPNQTLADINFDSLAEGVRLQPGDKVMLAQPATN